MSSQQILVFPVRPWLVNAVIAGVVGLMIVDGLPSVGKAHDRLRRVIDPVLDKSGLWQGGWELFAPEPDRVNVMVTAVVTYVDGTSRVWRSPDWTSMTPWEKFRHFRFMEYVDGVRRDAASGAWGALARHAAWEVGGAEPPASVALWRHWTVIAAPDSRKRSRLVAPRHGAIERRYAGHEEFFRWNPR